MLLSIPIYVDVRRTQGVQVHHCRPLLFPGPGADDPQLGKALTKLQRRLKPYLDARGRMERHDELSLCAWSPDLETHVLKTTIPLRDRTARCKLLWVVLRSLERRVAFAPALPHLWLEVSANERLEDRVQECLTQYFRDEEKNSGPYGTPIRPENLALQGQAWVSSVAIDVQTRMPDLKQQERQLAALFDETRMDGGVELQRVGRCLDWLYPTELPEAIERTAEVDQLDRLFTLPDRRPVVVVGPRLAGKSTVISACVRRRVQRRPRPFLPRHNVWLLSPQRLISGMMYVGQWEGRLQAILREAQRRKHVLYFDDFLGLYRAGLSRDASLSVADVLKPYIIRRDVRVLAEMTSEAWQVLQERDRGLADQFHVVRVSPTGPEATLRIMLEIHRQLEAEHSVEFDLDALPALVDLFGAYVRDTSFPGKTAVFSRQLARKRSGRTITREAVQEDFHQQTGLSLVLLDDRQRLDRDEAARQLRTRIVGQHEAIQAAAEVVAVTKARLSDPARPLATWLFLGPTGVGKTQCAKALAEVLFSDESRLLRFDMNEFVTPQAVAQLIGTFDEPDGLLTAAVRRQPFSVVLLDEIEKAHPDVFDLLLQVTGEGRLTDAFGRTADFSHTVIVMTSNLGTSASQPVGWQRDPVGVRSACIKAAENFFRPEFFNRIDRVIPFEPLSREEMGQVAQMVLSEVVARDGLVRRRCVLLIEPPALERIVDAGYHPLFGARALKRAVEQQIVQPVAASLANVSSDTPTLIAVYPQPGGITAIGQPLAGVPSPRMHPASEFAPDEQCARTRAFLQRLAADLERIRQSFSDTAPGLSPARLRYYALREHSHQVREQVHQLEDSIRVQRRQVGRPGTAPKTAPERPHVRSAHRAVPTARWMRDIQSARDIHDYLREAATSSVSVEPLEQLCEALRHETALLHSLWMAQDDAEPVLLVARPLIPAAEDCSRRLLAGLESAASYLSYAVERLQVPNRLRLAACQVSGPGIGPLITGEAGLHLFCRQHEQLFPVQLLVRPTGFGAPVDVVIRMCAERDAWLDRVATGAAQPESDPWPCGGIVRFYDEQGPILDIPTGRSLPSFPSGEQWKSLWLDRLALPREWEL